MGCILIILLSESQAELRAARQSAKKGTRGAGNSAVTPRTPTVVSISSASSPSRRPYQKTPGMTPQSTAPSGAAGTGAALGLRTPGGAATQHPAGSLLLPSPIQPVRLHFDAAATPGPTPGAPFQLAPVAGRSAPQPSSKDGSSPPAGGTASASMVCMPRPPLVLLSHHLISHCPCAPTGIFSDGRRAVPACPGRRLRTVGAAAVPTQRTLSSFRCRNGAYHLPDFH